MPVTRRRTTMFIVLAFAFQFVFLQGVVMTVVANDIMREMNLSPVAMGWLGSAYLYAYAGVMLVSGIVAAWLGPRATLTTLFALSGTGGLIFALSTSLPFSVIGRAASGMGLAATLTSSFTLFARWFPSASFSRISSWFIAIGGIGALLGIGPMAYLNEAMGWRFVFLTCAVLTLMYSLLAFILVRDWPPENAPGLAGIDAANRGETGLLLLWRSLVQVGKRLDFWRIIVWFCNVPGMHFAFCGLWAVPYFKQVYGFSHAEAGNLMSLVSFGFIIGTPLAALFSDRVVHSYRFTVGMSGVLSSLCMAIIIWRIDSLGVVSLSILIFAFGMALNATTGTMYGAARNLFGNRMTGITSGVFGCASFIGGALLQVVCGWILNFGESRQWDAATSYAAAFSPLIICGIIAAVAGFTLSKESFRE